MRIPRWLAWLLHRLPIRAKAKAFDVAVDQMSKPKEENNTPSAETQFNTSRLRWREIQQQRGKK